MDEEISSLFKVGDPVILNSTIEDLMQTNGNFGDEYVHLFEHR